MSLKQFYTCILLFSSITSCTLPSPPPLTPIVSNEVDFSLEDKMVEHLYSDSIYLDSLAYFLDDGADINIIYEKEVELTYRKLGSRIPIVKQFIGNKTSTMNVTVWRNPLHDLIGREVIANKMEAMVWLLKNGSDPNLSVMTGLHPHQDDTLLPVERFMVNALAFNELMGVYYDRSSFFHKNRYIKDQAKAYETNIGKYTMHYIDTLIAYGADPTIVNLGYAEYNIFLIQKFLKLGADPAKLDINLFLARGIDFQPEKVLEEIFSYELPYDDLKNLGDIVKMDIRYIKLIMKHGFDPNKSYGNSYLLKLAILYNKRDLVKFLLNEGVVIVDDKNTSPFDYAVANNIDNDKILKLLKKQE